MRTNEKHTNELYRTKELVYIRFIHSYLKFYFCFPWFLYDIPVQIGLDLSNDLIPGAPISCLITFGKFFGRCVSKYNGTKREKAWSKLWNHDFTEEIKWGHVRMYLGVWEHNNNFQKYFFFCFFNSWSQCTQLNARIL